MAEPARLRRGSGTLPLSSALTERLGRIHDLPDLDAAWEQYGANLQAVKEPDVRRLSEIETDLDAFNDPGAAPPSLPMRLPLLLAERLRTELDEAWARLSARSLVGVLKTPSLSFRSLADEVGVSAPYLSQLASGAGPVPSRRVLDKLVAAVQRQAGESPQLPVPPDEALRPLLARAEAVREFLRQHSNALHPKVHVDYPADLRHEKALRQSFETIAERSIDPEERSHIKAMLEMLVSADVGTLATLSRMAQDEGGAYALIRALEELDEPVRENLVGLIRSLAPEIQPALRTAAKKERRP